MIKRYFWVLILLTIFSISGCQSGGSSDQEDATPTQTGSATFKVQVSDVSNPSPSQSVGRSPTNALGTPAEITRITIKGVLSSNTSTVIPETEMDETSNGVWELTVNDLPVNNPMKFRVNAYNVSGVKIFTGWKETSITNPAPGENEILILLESIDDEVEPIKPSILSAEIPSEILLGSGNNIIRFNIKHTGPFEHEVSVVNGSIVPNSPDPTADIGNNTTALIYSYSAPAEATTDTVTIYAWETGSSDKVGTTYPITMVPEFSSTTKITLWLGPIATGMNFFRHYDPDSLDLELLVDSSDDVISNLTYRWVGTADFSDLSEDTRTTTIAPFSNTNAGTVTATVTDSKGVSASLIRTINLGDFNSFWWDSSPPKIPDTGQILCYDATGNTITCPAPGELMAQDGSYPANSKSFTDYGDGTVFDNNTKLMWQQSALVRHNYTEVATYCSSLRVGGYDNWRRPTLKELSSLVDRSRSNPSIDTTYFPDATGDSYWTSVKSGGTYTYLLYLVDFTSGVSASNSSPSGTNYTRCVRSRNGADPEIWPLEFSDVSGDSTVLLHNSTNLIWKKGAVVATNWSDAFEKCKNFSDELTYWRVPSINELFSIAEYSTTNRIDASFDSQTVNHWSSTTRADATDHAWYYSNGTIASDSKNGSNRYVRCVRNK